MSKKLTDKNKNAQAKDEPTEPEVPAIKYNNNIKDIRSLR